MVAMTREKAEELNTQAKAIFKDKRAKDLDACRVLYEIHEAMGVRKGGSAESHYEIMRAFGCLSWQDYVESGLGLSKREAERMVSVWAHFGVRLHGRCTRSQLLPLGMCKLRVLIRLTDEGNVGMWLERAKTLTYSQLECAAAERNAQAQPECEKTMPATYPEMFYFRREELDNLEQALARLRTEIPERRKGALVAQMIQEWLEYRAARDACAAQRKPLSLAAVA